MTRLAIRRRPNLERDIKAEVMLVLGGDPRLLIMSNPSGMARYANGAAVRYGVGLGNRGGADLIGLYRAGYNRGLFVAVEIKRPKLGRQSDEQRAFEAAVRSRHGIYVVLRSADEARAWLEEMGREYGA